MNQIWTGVTDAIRTDSLAKSSFSALYSSFWVEWWKGGKASGGNYFGSRMPRNYCYPCVQYILSKITSIKQGFYMLFIVTCHILLYRRKKIKPKSVILQHKIDDKNINRGSVREKFNWKIAPHQAYPSTTTTNTWACQTISLPYFITLSHTCNKVILVFGFLKTQFLCFCICRCRSDRNTEFWRSMPSIVPPDEVSLAELPCSN